MSTRKRANNGAHYDDDTREMKFFGMIVAVFHDHLRQLCCRDTLWHAPRMNRLFQDIQVHGIEINDAGDEAQARPNSHRILDRDCLRVEIDAFYRFTLLNEGFRVGVAKCPRKLYVIRFPLKPKGIVRQAQDEHHD
jgi:hypothetical protein